MKQKVITSLKRELACARPINELASLSAAAGAAGGGGILPSWQLFFFVTIDMDIERKYSLKFSDQA